MANPNQPIKIIESEREQLEKFTPCFERIKERTLYPNRGKEKAIVNKESKSAIAIRESGDVNLTSGAHSQINLTQDGKINSISMEEDIYTNKVKLRANDIIINHHKLNPKTYEFTDFREVLRDDYEEPIDFHKKKLVGNFTMLGTVLVKAWDHDRQRYVLIRRQVRMAMFSNKLNLAEIYPELNIEDSIGEDIDELGRVLD